MSTPVALSFVERGWQSARMLSIALVTERQFRVTHYLKGTVAPEVLAMITPYPGMRIVPVARQLFCVVTLAVLLATLVRRQLRLVIVDHPRTSARARLFLQPWRIPLVEAAEETQRLCYRWNGRQYALADLVEQV